MLNNLSVDPIGELGNGTFCQNSLSPQQAFERGWSIIPCGLDKKPFHNLKWKVFQERKPTTDELREWMSWNPPAWAVITGSISGIITLDFDKGRDGEETLFTLSRASLEAGKDPIEPHRKTGGGGYHVDFYCPTWTVKTLQSGTPRTWSSQYPGLDVRATGGYCLFFGRNQYGEYRWLRDPEPYSLDLLPLDLRNTLGLLHPSEAPKPVAPIEAKPLPKADGRGARLYVLLNQAIENARANGRNNAGFGLLTQLRDNGYGESEAESIGSQFIASVPSTNAKGSTEAYTLAEWRASLRQVYGRPARQPWDPPKQAPRVAPRALNSDRQAGDFETARDESFGISIQVTNRELPEITGQALEALKLSNEPPTLFSRNGQMVSVHCDERGRQSIAELSEHALRGRMARTAVYFKTTAKKETVIIAPPLDVVRDLRALPASDWGFPPLDAVAEAPALRSDGSIVDSPGYDERTALYYAPPPDLKVPAIPDSPNADDVDWAKSMVDEAIGQFPFVDEASKANAIACLLTPFIKPAVNAPTPLALFEAPQAGTGKSLLADVISMVARGRAGDMLIAPQDPDEWRKKITMALSMGSSPVIFDNVSSKLDADALASALTSNSVGDRAFGTHHQITLPVKCAWIATGNNIRLGGDIPRRCYWIRLDAKTSKPFRRSGFRHPNLLQWVSEHRAELIAAVLILARAWFAKGRPQADLRPMGSFEAWSEMAAGILHNAGIEGFLANADEMFEMADTDAVQWEGFLLGLLEVFGDESFKSINIVEKLFAKSGVVDHTDGQKLREVLPDYLAEGADKSQGFLQRRLGYCLAERIDKRYGQEQVFLARAFFDKRSKVQLYKVCKP